MKAPSIPIDRVERPTVHPGQWLDCSVREFTLVGCQTCEWYEEGPYEEVRELWLAHTHDPLFDIKARAAAGRPELLDVLWLLDKVKEP